MYYSALLQQVAADAARRDLVRNIEHERYPLAKAAAVVVSHSFGVAQAAKER